MLKLFFLLICTAGITCTEFSTHYARIEEDRIRLLDFIYEPTEAAPGDTVLVKALFAGKEIAPQDISWRASFATTMNSNGTDTAYNEVPLDCTVEPYHFSDRTTCLAMRFVVPKNCILKSPAINDDWKSNLPPQLYSVLPEQLLTLTKNELVGMIDSLSQYLDSADSQQKMQVASLLPPELTATIPLIMQLLTVKIRLYAYVKNSHRIKSDYSVSYASRFSSLPGLTLPLNHNPHIDSIGLYIVKGSNLNRFDRQGDSTEYITLSRDYNNDSIQDIIVKRGYTYFLEAFVYNRDSVLTLFDIVNTEPVSTEELSAEWLFEMNKEEAEGVGANDVMNIVPLSDLTAVLYLPRDTKIEQFTIWVQVTDSKMNVINRSQGSTVSELHGTFTY